MLLKEHADPQILMTDEHIFQENILKFLTERPALSRVAPAVSSLRALRVASGPSTITLLFSNDMTRS